MEVVVARLEDFHELAVTDRVEANGTVVNDYLGSVHSPRGYRRLWSQGLPVLEETLTKALLVLLASKTSLVEYLLWEP